MLAYLQKLVAADKAPLAAALVGALTVLAAKFGMKLNGSDVAYVSAGVMGLLGLFVHVHFARKPAQKVALIKTVQVPAEAPKS